MTARGVVGLALVALLAGPCRADEEGAFAIEPGKINANDAGVLDPGQVELQPGYGLFTSRRRYDAGGMTVPASEVRQDLLATQFTFGVVEDFDVNLTLGLAGGRDTMGGVDPITRDPHFLADHSLADLTFGTRWRFFRDDEEGWQLAYLTYTTFPTARHHSDQGLSLSQEAATLQHHLVVQKEVGHWSLLADLGALHPLASNGPGLTWGLTTALAAGYQVTAEFQPLVEIAYNSTSYTRAPLADSLTVTGGATCYVTPDVRLNLGLTRTLAGHNTLDGLGTTFFVTFTP